MIRAASEGEQEQICYLTFKELTEPDLDLITVKSISEGFESKEWRKNFETLTHLRRANRFYGSILVQELLPQVYKQIISQIDNLRSNNSKEALTLANEILSHQNIEKIDKNIICSIVNALFVKTNSEKSFLKKEALNAVEQLSKKYNPHLLSEISNQTLSINGAISELAAKILVLYIENNLICDFEGELLIVLGRLIDGKRAVLQKKGKEIVHNMKKRMGEEKMISCIDSAKIEEKISEDEHRILIQEIKKEEKQIKNHQSLKDFIGMKKKADSY